jgi:hypothetical protein
VLIVVLQDLFEPPARAQCPHLHGAVRDAKQSCDLDIHVFVAGRRGNRLGQHLGRIAVTLDKAGYDRARRDRIRERVTLAVTGQPARVKAVLFEYASNRASAASTGVR